MAEILRVKDLSFKYGNRFILQGIEFSLNEGTLLGLIGPNGSGKSTLLKLLDGLLRPFSGTIEILSKPIGNYTRKELVKKVAMIGQETHFRFAFTALEVVLMGRFPHLSGLQLEGKRDLLIAKEAMELTNTLHLAQRNIHELSGGEKQRVLLAMALAQRPRLLLLDEPTSFLDPHYKLEMFLLIRSLLRQKAMGIVVVTHDLDLAAQFCDEFLLLKEGRIVSKGPALKVLSKENIAQLYGCDALVDQNPITGTLRINIFSDHKGRRNDSGRAFCKADKALRWKP